MIHEGHRERLRNRFLIAASSFEDHELLELLLFYAVPRKNTNEIAHKLLERFGSLKGVLDAGIPALKSVDGMGDNAALFFRVIAETLFRYENHESKTVDAITSYAALGDYMRNLFVGTEDEISYILFFDMEQKLLSCKKLSQGFACGNIISNREIATEAVIQNAAGAILVHNHPKGSPNPSKEDLFATGKIKNLLESLGVSFIDHFIVAKGKCVPILSVEKAPLYNQNLDKGKNKAQR